MQGYHAESQFVLFLTIVVNNDKCCKSNVFNSLSLEDGYDIKFLSNSFSAQTLNFISFSFTEFRNGF